MFQYMSNFNNKYCFNLNVKTQKHYRKLLNAKNTDVNFLSLQ